jgi:quinol monooxygenase YgiN
MYVRINDVTVDKGRVDELRDVLSNKALPVVRDQKGSLGLMCAVDRATGNCAIVSRWDSKESLDASEKAIASIRSATVDALNATLNNIVIAEVLREIRVGPSQVGTQSRVVRITAPASKAGDLLAFFDTEAIPRLQTQSGFLNARLIHEVEQGDRFAAVSHWTDMAALQSSETASAKLRDQAVKTIARAAIEGVTTSEIILTELVT